MLEFTIILDKAAVNLKHDFLLMNYQYLKWFTNDDDDQTWWKMNSYWGGWITSLI